MILRLRINEALQSQSKFQEQIASVADEIKIEDRELNPISNS